MKTCEKKIIPYQMRKLNHLNKFLCLVSAILLIGMLPHAEAQSVPEAFNYQGILLDATGAVLPPADYTVDFSIWEATSGGTAPVWGPQRLTVSVASDGYFNVTLGPQDDNGLSILNAFTDSSRYLEIAVCEDDDTGTGTLVCTALAPRHRIVSTPFALAAGSAGRILGDASGNVGIGVENPTDKLEVGGNLKVEGSSILSGNVSIGTSQQFAKLVVAGSGGFGQSVAIDTNELKFRGDGKAHYSIYANRREGINALTIENTSSSSLPGTDTHVPVLMALKANGHVGVGTEDPSARFHVAGPMKIDGANTLEFGAGIEGKNVVAGQIGYGTFSQGLTLDIVGAGGNEDRKTQFYSEGGVGIQGNVGIGMELRFREPEATLHVAGDMKIDGGHTLEFGAGIQGKEINAGKIGYGTFTPETLNIVGAGTGSDRKIQFFNEGGARFNGNIGIGTDDTTKGRLHVDGNGNSHEVTYAFLNNNASVGAISNPLNISYSIWASGRIRTAEINVMSDIRTKKVKGVSDSRADLQLLNRLQVTDYTYIDTITRGEGVKKKLIAQKLETVYPQAVSKTADFIPNVYDLSELIETDGKAMTITCRKDHDLKCGDRVKIIDDSGELIETVMAVPGPKSFTVKTTRAPEKVFVYGKEVDDFRVVDYDAISMLNVSATQELAKRLENLEQENSGLKNELASMKTTVAAMKQSIASLEQLLALRLQDNTTKVASKK